MAEPTPPTRTGYSTDQFANFKDYENGSPQADGQDNPAFAYPGNRVPNVYDHAGEGTTDTRVQRGFIRGIFPEILNAQIAANKKLDKDRKSTYTAAAGPAGAVTRRCFFQFNPALILRSVEASTTVLNPLLQPATELLQPIPGQAAFEFQLLFNREREVSNHRMASGFDDTTGDPTMSKVGTFSNNLKDYGATGTNPYSREHVAELGVLADLYVLDSIIGQSITQDSIDALTSYWDITQQNKTSKSSTVVNQDGTKTVTTTKPDGSVDVQSYKADGTEGTLVQTPADANIITNFTDKDTKKKLASVLGNSAFLSPLPIRIVFSSLFMVEGFVTSSNVAFHKFSNTMVPTVCSVTLNVQALYLGFAKKESYVSQQLTTQFKTTAAAVQEQIDAQATAKKALQGLSLIVNYVIPHGSYGTDSLNSWWAFGASHNWDFLQRDIDGNGARFDSNTHADGIICWVNDELAASIKSNNVQNIKIEKIELIFINKDAIPKPYRNIKEVKASLDKTGSVPGSGAKSKTELLRTEINIVKGVGENFYPNGSGSNGKTAADAIQTVDIEKSTAGNPIKKPWQSSGLQTGLTTNTRFGTTNIMVAVVVKISCHYPYGTTDSSPDPVSIFKSAVIEVSPTTANFIFNSQNGSLGFTIK